MKQNLHVNLFKSLLFALLMAFSTVSYAQDSNNETSSIEEEEYDLIVVPTTVYRGTPFTIITTVPEEQLVGAEFLISNMNGKVVAQELMETDHYTMELNESAGIYMVALRLKSGKAYFARLVLK